MENHRSDGSSTRPIFKPRFRVQEGNMKKRYTCIDCGASCQFVSRFATNRKLGYRCFSILVVFSKLSRKVEIPRGGEPLAKRLTAVAAKRRVAIGAAKTRHGVFRDSLWKSSNYLYKFCTQIHIRWRKEKKEDIDRKELQRSRLMQFVGKMEGKSVKERKTEKYNKGNRKM